MDAQRPLLMVAEGELEPWAKYIEYTPDNIRVEGPIFEVLKILSEVLQFDYKLLQPPDSAWGSPYGNGSWSGMVGMIQREEVELALGPLSMTPGRNKVVNFSYPIYSDSDIVVTRRPSSKNEMHGFLKPFTTEVWLCTLSSMVIIATAFSAIQHIEGWIYNVVVKNVVTKSILWAIKTFTQEGSKHLPEKDSSRILVATWLFASLVFMSSYCGILIAMLTAPTVEIPINSLEDLVSQTEIPWKTKRPGSFIMNYFQASENVVHKKALERSSGTIFSCWNSRDDVASGEFATFCPESEILKILSWDFSTSGRCRLYVAQVPNYSNDNLGLAFRKNSSYIEGTNKIIGSLKESGILDHWLAVRLANASQCLKPPKSDGLVALPIEAIAGPFITMVGAYIFALMIFISEIVIHRFTRK